MSRVDLCAASLSRTVVCTALVQIAYLISRNSGKSLVTSVPTRSTHHHAGAVVSPTKAVLTQSRFGL